MTGWLRSSKIRISMKYLLFVIVLTILVVSSAIAQGPATSKAAPNNPVARARSDKFPREKFDPLRDPKLDLDKAVEAAGKTGKRIILDVGGEWCGWCVYMDKFFVLNPSLAKLRDKSFVWVKVNFSDENENKAFLSPYPEALGFPHLYILETDGRFLHSQDTSVLEKGKGYDPAKFTAFLKTWSSKK